MKILLIGGTGLVGSYLLPKLIENKFKIYALTRSNEKLPKINSLGAMGVLGDIRHPDSFIQSINKLDLIILLAMPGIKPGKRVTKKRFILADDGPVTQKDFTFCMADIMNIRRPKSIPEL